MDLRSMKGVQALTAAAAITADISSGAAITLAATTDSVITFSNGQIGLPAYLIITQDGTGGRAITFANANVRNNKAINTIANSVSFLEVRYNGTDYDIIVSNTLGDRKEASDTLTFSATPTIDWDSNTADNKALTLTANVTSSTFNATRPGWYTLELTQDGTGGRTFAWPVGTTYTGVVPEPNSTASSTTVFLMYYNGTNFRIVSVG